MNKIKGYCIQEGEPTPNSPIEIETFTVWQDPTIEEYKQLIKNWKEKYYQMKDEIDKYKETLDKIKEKLNVLNEEPYNATTYIMVITEIYKLLEEINE